MRGAYRATLGTRCFEVPIRRWAKCANLLSNWFWM